MRKLVTVRRVSSTRPIDGAKHRIQVASIDGWQCVVQKNEFVEGDLGVYFEIDSFLPAADPRWAFLANRFMTWENRHGFRVKTMKMRGQLSQGLLVPLALCPEVSSVLTTLIAERGREDAEKKVMEMSFEDVLGVIKYEKPDAERAGYGFYGDLPPFIQKTDQERCRNLTDLFDKWSDATFQETTKMDGSSMTVYFLRTETAPYSQPFPPLDTTLGHTALQPNGRVGVGSRNKDIVESDTNLFWGIARGHSLPAKLSTLNRNVAIQGELCGSSVQGNFEGFPRGFHDFIGATTMRRKNSARRRRKLTAPG